MKLNAIRLFLITVLLLGAGVGFTYLGQSLNTSKSTAEVVQKNIARELAKVEEQASQITRTIDEPETLPLDYYPFFIYRGDSLTFWSDNHFVPSPASVADTFSVKLLKMGSSSYLIKKTLVADFGAIVSVIPLQRDYIIHNDYLSPEWNREIFPGGDITILESGSTGIPICLDENCLFNIVHTNSDYTLHYLDLISFVILLGALVSLILLIGKGLEWIKGRFAEGGILYLYLSFLIVRWLMIEAEFPSRFVQSPLFDPQIFASSSLNASLGDLLINSIALLGICVYAFRNYHRFYFVRRQHSIWIDVAIRVVAAVCIFFSALFPFVVIQTIYNNSVIALDISESLEFNSLRVVALIVIAIASACFFLFAHPFIRLLARGRNHIMIFSALVVGAAIFAQVNEISRQQYFTSLILGGIYFIVVYSLRLYRNLSRLTYGTFTYLFIAIFINAIGGAYAIQHFSHREKIESQFRFSSNFLDRDIFGEYLLHDASEKIANDAFTQARIVTPFLGTEAIALKIRQVFLPSYFNKYDVEIFIFGASGEPVGNPEGLSFFEMVRRYDSEPFRTAYDGIYFVNNPETDITQKYLLVIPIQRGQSVAGYVVVELSLKKVIPESVYPELLVDYGFQQFYRSENISYGIFVNGNILLSSGDFNYQKYFNRSLIGNVDLYSSGVTTNGYDHIAQEDQNGRIAVVSTPSTPFAYQLANFSFLFVLGLFIILILIFFQGIYNYFLGRRLFFSARIQLYLNLAFFIPLIIVSISILGLTSRSSQRQLDEEYLDKSRLFGEEINSELDQYLRTGINPTSFSNRLIELAALSNLDANIYDPSGRLLSTTQPLIFESHLLSPMVNARALKKIKSGDNSFVESESVGKLEYFIAYAAIKSTQTAELIGVLTIPFFQSAYLLEQAQIVILTNILNIFAFIFIALLILSYFVSEWLTFPLKFITQSLRRTSFNKLNQPLSWKTDDEIGLMVKEYNAMLYHLSESKNQLEQTQREKAWREIAQQVAHEIKNPLTPMKLTLQQLERAIQSGTNVEEKSKRAISVLLSQVDTLNEIASSFSGFAKMPEPVIKRMDLVATVKSAVDLHNTGGEIIFRVKDKEIFIQGDEQMLHRTFSNLILNAIQAARPGESIRIVVSIVRYQEKVQVSIQDNGKGIDPSIADLVFLPHFSTKKSGSGIGLALSKQGIELMNGKIWFETSSSGTTFFVELPLA